MKVFNIHLKVLIGFAIAIAGIGFFLYTTYKNSQLSITDSQNIAHELKIMKISESLLDDVQDLETSYRGFVVTGDEKYLAPFNSSTKTIPIHIHELLQTAEQDSIDLKIALLLNEFLQEKIKYANEIISLRKNGNTNAAIELIKTDKGIFLMNQIRKEISILEDKGRVVLNESNQKKELIANETKQNFIVLSLVLLFQLILVYLIIAGDLKKNDQNQLAILEANDRILDLYDQAPCGYLSLDKDGKITEINKTALAWLGYHENDIKGKKKLSELAPKSLQLTLDNLLNKASLINHEIELTTSTGRNLPFLIDTKINYDNSGERNYIRTVLTDIKERKKAESKVNHLATLIENTNDSIISTDKNLIIKSWNNGSEKMFGFTSAEAIGCSFFDFLKLPTSHEFENEMWNDLMSNGKWIAEATFFKGDSKPIYIRNSVSIFNQNNDANFILIFIIQDISAQKQHEKTLQRFNLELQQKVQEQTEEISSIFNRISEGFASLDNDFNITFANPYAEKLVGLNKENIIGLNFIEHYKNVPNPTILDLIRSAKSTNKSMEFEEYSEHYQRWMHVKVYPSERGIAIFFQDVTARKEAETKLIENEKKYRLLFQNNPISMWVIELNNFTILDVNQAAIDQYEYSYNEFIGKSINELYPTEEADKYLTLTKEDKANSIIAGTWTHLKKNGEQIKVEVLVYSMIYDGKPSRLILSNDITEKLKSQEELEASRDQLRNLSSYLEKIREDERTSIAREIHDELGQQLTGLKMDVSWIARRLKDNDAALNEKIQGMILLIDDTVKTVRKIASELRPGILDDLGLIAALDWQSKEFEKRTGIKCNFTSDQIDHNFNKDMATGIFRIYQEALTNVARHAKASKVDSSIVVNNDEMVEITIKDNGIGMKNELFSKSKLGLIGMKERAFMMKGELLINSEKGKGTKIKLKIPFHN